MVELTIEPARKADEANGSPSTAQTVGVNDGKDTDPPGGEDGDVREMWKRWSE